MATLCIDTATADGMVVVARDGVPRATARWRSAGRHGENLFSHIDSAMADAGIARDELSLLGVSIGPGGFTSLRVGLATAKGLALGLGLPIVGVSSLRVQARSITGDASLVRVPLLNAYRGDVFSAAFAFDQDAIVELVTPRFGPPEEILGRIRDAVGERAIAVGGEGVLPNQDAIERIFGTSLVRGLRRTDSATPEGLLAEVLHIHASQGPADLARLEPHYLRSSDAKLPRQPLRTGPPT